MNMKFSSLLLLILSINGAFAQNKTGQDNLLASVSSPTGNYIYLSSEKEVINNESTFKNTDYFIIERAVYNPAKKAEEQSDFKKIGESRPVQSVNQLKDYFTSKEIADIKKSFKLKNDDNLLKVFNSFRGWEKYDFLYSISPRFRVPKGVVFIDKDAKGKEVYVYKVTRVDKNTGNQLWGQTIVESNSGNYLLSKLKPVSSVVSFDSSFNFKWQIPVSASTIRSITPPVTSVPFEKSGLSKAISFLPYSINAKLYLSEAGNFVEKFRLLGSMNKTGDTIYFSCMVRVKPEEIKSAFIVTEDEVNNTGAVSDTAIGVAVTNRTTPLIYGIRTEDVLNGVRISWNKLPSKPYITGVEITRFNSRDELDTIAIVPPSDTVFIDYKCEVGQHYRYQVRTKFFPNTGLSQKTPATGVGTFTKFTRPMAPYEVSAENSGQDVLLKWKAIDEPGLYGFYVYRGTSTKNIALLAGPIFKKYYKDTSASLSGNSQYYYRLVSQNYRQDTSMFTSIVSIIPNRKIDMISPSNLSTYYINGRVKIYWEDVRKINSAIQSFVLQKRKSGEKEFKFINDKLIIENSFEDTSIKMGTVYEYRAASVSFKGDTSSFGEVTEFNMPAKNIEIINIFYVRNAKNGIEISWPSMLSNRKGYCIYRRKANEERFTKIATVDVEASSYLDKNVNKGIDYVYRMSILEKDGREGVTGKSISIKSNQGK